MPERPFPRAVGIVGLGLMGGSVARAIRRAYPSIEVLASTLDRADAEKAMDAGAVHRVVTPAGMIGEVGLLVLAVPLGAVGSVLDEIVAAIDEGVGVGETGGASSASPWITDLVSLKLPVVEEIRRVGLGGRYVGAHPMAGGEGRGFGASRHDLFEGARIWLVRGEAGSDAREVVEGFWSRLGGRPAWLDPREHDALMTRVSHLPQLVANLLADLLAGEGVDPGTLGPGGADMTRLASSSPAIWSDLVRARGHELVPLLRRMAERASDLAERLEASDWEAVEALMRATAEWCSRGEEG